MFQFVNVCIGLKTESNITGLNFRDGPWKQVRVTCPHPNVFDPQSGFVSRQRRLDPVSFLVQPLELHPLLQTLLPTGPHVIKPGTNSTEIVQGLLDVDTPCLPIGRALLKRFPQTLHLLQPEKTQTQVQVLCDVNQIWLNFCFTSYKLNNSLSKHWSTSTLYLLLCSSISRWSSWCCCSRATAEATSVAVSSCRRRSWTELAQRPSSLVCCWKLCSLWASTRSCCLSAAWSFSWSATQQENSMNESWYDYWLEGCQILGSSVHH